MSIRINGGNLIDGISADPRPNAGICTEDGVIERVDANGGGRPDITIDAENMTILPGLIDAHLHLFGFSSLDLVKVMVTEQAPLRAIRAAKDAEQLIAAGYTTVRCMGSDVSVSLRQAIREGRVNGPTLVAAGPGISQTAGHGDRHSLPLDVIAVIPGTRLADGPDECRKAVREQLRQNVDVIKICTSGGVISEYDDPEQTQFTPDEVRAITEEAHRFGKPVAAHAEAVPGIRLAVECGVDTIEHGTILDEETCALLAKKNIPIVTTFTICELIVDMLLEQKMTLQYEKLMKVTARYGHNIQMAKSLGVRIATGTDMVGISPLDHGKNALEMVLLHKLAGFSPMEAIQASTSVAAGVLGMEDRIGCIRPGYDADLVIMAQNPLDDLERFLNPANILYVIRKGRIVHKAN